MSVQFKLNSLTDHMTFEVDKDDGPYLVVYEVYWEQPDRPSYLCISEDDANDLAKHERDEPGLVRQRWVS